MQTAGKGCPTLVKKLGLLRQRAGVRDDGKGVHLQMVVVMEAQGLMELDPLVQLESHGIQPLFAAGMAGVQDGHIVGLG